MGLKGRCKVCGRPLEKGQYGKAKRDYPVIEINVAVVPVEKLAQVNN